MSLTKHVAAAAGVDIFSL